MDLPDDDTLRWIVRKYARLCSAHGEAIGTPALVRPAAQFFPDAFHGDPASVARLLRRMIGYAPIADDLNVEIAFVDVDGEETSGCGSISCGSSAGLRPRARGVEEIDDGYRVLIAAHDVGHPDLLTASLARSVGALVLFEGDVDAEAAAVTAEIAAAACGFGVLLANGAAVWGKSCGGLRMARGTALSVEETTVALALFVALHDIDPAEARVDLRATQREAFDLAHAWIESNPLLLEGIRDRPALLEAGAFDIEPVRGVFGRWLRKRQLDKEIRAKRVAAKPAPSEARMRRLEEARALVDEVIGATSSFGSNSRE